MDVLSDVPTPPSGWLWNKSKQRFWLKTLPFLYFGILTDNPPRSEFYHMRVPVHGRVRKPQFSTMSPVLIFMIFFTNHGQCMAYDKRPSPIFAGTMQMQYNLKVTSTMPIWIRYGIVYVYCYGNLFLSITEFMEYKIKYTIISVRTIWFRWKLPMSPEVEFMTT